jgi:hypothetical protein
MEAGFSETSLLFYQTARRHIQDDCNLTDTIGSHKMEEVSLHDAYRT